MLNLSIIYTIILFLGVMVEKCMVLLSFHFVNCTGYLGTETCGCLRLIINRVLSLILTTSVFVFLNLSDTVFCCYTL